MLHFLSKTVLQCRLLPYNIRQLLLRNPQEPPWFHISKAFYIYPVHFPIIIADQWLWSLCNACHGHDNDRIHIRDDRITYQCIFSYIFQDCLVKKEDDNPTWEFCYPGRHAVTDLPPDSDGIRWNFENLIVPFGPRKCHRYKRITAACEIPVANAAPRRLYAAPWPEYNPGYSSAQPRMSHRLSQALDSHLSWSTSQMNKIGYILQKWCDRSNICSRIWKNMIRCSKESCKWIQKYHNQYCNQHRQDT